MDKMLEILKKHRANFSVEFFARHEKVRVKQTKVFDRRELWTRPLFKELWASGYTKNEVHSIAGATPTVVVEYCFDQER